MLHHRDTTEAAPTVIRDVTPVGDGHGVTQESPKRRSTFAALYREFVTENPICWKETHRADLSTLSPEGRTRARAMRERNAAKLAEKSLLRRRLESLCGLLIVFLVSWIAVKAIFHNADEFQSFGGALSFLFISPIGLANNISNSIRSEREKRTWNALILSRLTPGQILFGKFWMPIQMWIGMNVFYLCLALPLVLEGLISPVWLAIAIPVVVTAPLPIWLHALRSGLFAAAQSKFKTARGLAGPVLLGATGLVAGALGALPYSTLSNAPLQGLLAAPWIVGAINLLWARHLWRGLLRDFPSALGDFTG